jgi:hypothetical protein
MHREEHSTLCAPSVLSPVSVVNVFEIVMVLLVLFVRRASAGLFAFVYSRVVVGWTASFSVC